MIKLKFPLLVITLTCVATVCKPSAFGINHIAKAYSHTKPTHNNDDGVAATLCADDLLSFAQTLIGVRYHSASSSPVHGFDCSGFVSYVFKNFSIEVPRSSYEFASVGEKVALADARPGDVILFTGTSKRSRRIGHVGIIMSNDNDGTTFIHSTSGKEHGVTITAMDKTYHRRFVKIVRLLKQNDLS
ncbi:C40 family peptidase [Mucilaginibacter sp. HMF5004]|uniref:C40 family peptidase n=1 Tax=Mucilaginibacter rivuli TaxID=2857527 RepID=UPI001C5CD260|nr:C40 family peptidase [Mucilaginibacter rivuli]MBW4888876.1 C40 family peptidase [Mucilaginibacter rivuli]